MSDRGYRDLDEVTVAMMLALSSDVEVMTPKGAALLAYRSEYVVVDEELTFDGMGYGYQSEYYLVSLGGVEMTFGDDYLSIEAARSAAIGFFIARVNLAGGAR